MLALLAAIALAAALGPAARREQGERRAAAAPQARGWFALTAICAGLALAIASAPRRSRAPLLDVGAPPATRRSRAIATRTGEWRSGVRRTSRCTGWGPAAGRSGGCATGTIHEFAQDAHSLELQTLAELGVVGLALLAVFLAGIGFAARDAYRAAPALAAGPIAGVVVWIAHSPLDWDWQMPAVTLIAMVPGRRPDRQTPTALRRSAAPRG